MKLTKSKLKQMIKEELEGEWVLKKTGKSGYVQKATSEKPSNIKSPNFEGSDPKIFKSKVDAEGWKKAAQEASGLALTVEPKESSEPLNEDVMDQNVLEGMLQIMNNFGMVTWPALAAAVGMTVVELKEKIRSYAAKKAGVNIKTQ